MSLIERILPALFDGAFVTIRLFSLTLIMSLPLGLLIGLCSVSRIKIIQGIIGAYTWVIRGTPLLLQIIFIYFGLPMLLPLLKFDRFEAVLLAFVINYAAYFAEIFRGGIQSIPKGQYEGAKVLGLNKFQTGYRIIVPQVFKTVLPSLGNEVITLVKDTSLVHIVGLTDLLRAGQQAMVREVTILPLVVVAVMYLILTGIVTLVLKYTEKKFDYYR